MPVATASKEFTTGRHGLKIPTFEPKGANVKALDVFMFFHGLWERNGFPINDDTKQPKKFQHELVIPASRNKPITLLAGNFTPTSKVDQARQGYEEALAADDEGWFISKGIITGHEAHAIKSAPMRGLGKPALVLSASYAHREELDPYFDELWELGWINGSNKSRYALLAERAAPEGAPLNTDRRVIGPVMENLVMDAIRLLSTNRGQ